MWVSMIRQNVLVFSTVRPTESSAFKNSPKACRGVMGSGATIVTFLLRAAMASDRRTDGR